MELFWGALHLVHRVHCASVQTPVRSTFFFYIDPQIHGGVAGSFMRGPYPQGGCRSLSAELCMSATT